MFLSFSTHWTQRAVRLWFNNNKNVYVKNAQPLFIHDDIKENPNTKFHLNTSIKILAQNTSQMKKIHLLNF